MYIHGAFVKFWKPISKKILINKLYHTLAAYFKPYKLRLIIIIFCIRTSSGYIYRNSSTWTGRCKRSFGSALSKSRFLAILLLFRATHIINLTTVKFGTGRELSCWKSPSPLPQTISLAVHCLIFPFSSHSQSNTNLVCMNLCPVGLSTRSRHCKFSNASSSLFMALYRFTLPSPSITSRTDGSSLSWGLKRALIL